MPKKLRNFLFSLFVIIFFTATPLLLIYALGYNLNFAWPPRLNMILQKTGMLIVDSEPSGANIYLNGKLQTTSESLFSSKDPIATPAKIKNLVPGEYDVKVILEGYWPWEKKLYIHPGSNTFAENIVLFKNNLPVRLYEKKCEKMVFSPDQQKIAALCGDQIILYDLRSNVSETISTTSQQDIGIVWSPDNEKLAFENKIFLIAKDKDIVLGGNLLKNFYWRDGNTVYYALNDSIYEFDINSNRNEQIIKTANGQDIENFIIHNKKIYYLQKNNSNIDFIAYDQNDKKIELTINIPLSDEYEFYWDDLIYAHDISHSTLYLLDTKNTISPLKSIIKNCTRFIKADKDRMICANEFEIFQYDLNSNNSLLLARISEPISSLLWHKSNNYLIYSTNEGIYSFELDNREKNNITKISGITKVSKLLSDKNSNLYFISDLENFSGIFKQAIR